MARQKPVMLDVQTRFSDYLGRSVRLSPATTKGGYDEIYYATDDGGKFAVVRVNSKYKSQNDPIGKWDPGIPLGPEQRLDREWEAYTKLHPAGISPEPLWRSHDAIACSWVNWDRASRRLVSHRSDLWEIMQSVFPVVKKMHECGVTHLDLNLGNILIEPEGTGVCVIDFEFGPVNWVVPEQQRAFDYLRLIDDFIKKRRGGDLLLADVDRVADLLDKFVAHEDRSAELSFVFHKLKRLAGQDALVAALQRVFPRLVLNG